MVGFGGFGGRVALAETTIERLRLQPHTSMVAARHPSNPMQTFTLRLSPRLLQWIDQQREEEESRASVVRRALIAAMKAAEAGSAE